ncbi:MOSC N-terminal beta barrel domain-containing protein [Acidimicrobiia bacterium EGI L10123]|uniref:MOSC domain-containing protein n=1 Tax=Salinilacustrithrix flava TaxID=2957203 RepID=UPI003D7C1AED|nr:MOSC N-terminal beta barrel domain-containing protein [Acidimicrobiia bacterium EGI L10123]
MQVTQLWRYPVKSMIGESLTAADIGPLGIDGDRQWGLVDRETGLVLTARRAPQLLFAEPVARGDGMAVRLPDGAVTDDDDVLSAWVGRPVELRRPAPDERGHYAVEGAGLDDEAPERWEGPAGVWHDSTRTRLSIVAEEALGGRDVRRFRPNVVIRGGDERDLAGSRIRLGGVVADVVKEIDRCVIVTRPQPGLERDRSVLTQVRAERAGNLGVGALVVAAGRISLGDALEVA